MHRDFLELTTALNTGGISYMLFGSSVLPLYGVKGRKADFDIAVNNIWIYPNLLRLLLDRGFELVINDEKVSLLLPKNFGMSYSSVLNNLFAHLYHLQNDEAARNATIEVLMSDGRVFPRVVKDELILEFHLHAKGYRRNIFDRRKSVICGNHPIDIIGLEDLVILKILYHRPKDLEDCKVILGTGQCNMNFIREELDEIGPQDSWTTLKAFGLFHFF